MATKTRITKKQVIAQRTRAVKDNSPNWEGCESWDGDQFHRHFRNAMNYHRLESEIKTYKPVVVKWMTDIDCAKADIAAIKKVKDNRINTTMGAIAHCLTRGMTAQRADFNSGRDTAAWLRAEIVKVINEGKDDVDPDVAAAEKEANKVNVYVPSIQERLRDVAMNMTEEIENAVELFSQDPEGFDPKAFKMLNLLKSQQAKAAHARVIRDLYQRQHDEYVELQAGKCEQLKEGYSHLTKSQIKKIAGFYADILSACDMLMQEAKVNKKPRAKKAVPADKIVGKLKYMKTDQTLKLVSINPVDILGVKELWVYNTKTRKLGKYVAGEFSDLGIKGTAITGFDEHKSVQKTLRKPEDQLKEFKAAGKVVLRKFLDDIKAVDIKLNGRINEDTILLKVQ